LSTFFSASKILFKVSCWNSTNRETTTRPLNKGSHIFDFGIRLSRNFGLLLARLLDSDERFGLKLFSGEIRLILWIKIYQKVRLNLVISIWEKFRFRSITSHSEFLSSFAFKKEVSPKGFFVLRMRTHIKIVLSILAGFAIDGCHHLSFYLFENQFLFGNNTFKVLKGKLCVYYTFLFGNFKSSITRFRDSLTFWSASIQIISFRISFYSGIIRFCGNET
jgi:hypothetical protein